MEDLNLSLLRKDRHSLISSNVPAMTKLYKNVLNPAIAKYAGLGPELQAYLRERYGEGIDFKVTVSYSYYPLWCWILTVPTSMKMIAGTFEHRRG